mmetsp:Transcript_27074/g.108375  ORF Transcript_27074/g.108375 Transcript_27074/m.108375 type:complete len:281 (+) Transcript_27074:328-1170(+)
MTAVTTPFAALLPRPPSRLWKATRDSSPRSSKSTSKQTSNATTKSSSNGTLFVDGGTPSFFLISLNAASAVAKRRRAEDAVLLSSSSSSSSSPVTPPTATTPTAPPPPEDDDDRLGASANVARSSLKMSIVWIIAAAWSCETSIRCSATTVSSGVSHQSPSFSSAINSARSDDATDASAAAASPTASKKWAVSEKSMTRSKTDVNTSPAAETRPDPTPKLRAPTTADMTPSAAFLLRCLRYCCLKRSNSSSTRCAYSIAAFARSSTLARRSLRRVATWRA